MVRHLDGFTHKELQELYSGLLQSYDDACKENDILREALEEYVDTDNWDQLWSWDSRRYITWDGDVDPVDFAVNALARAGKV